MTYAAIQARQGAMFVRGHDVERVSRVAVLSQDRPPVDLPTPAGPR
ncbi:MAG TPA: hypothetical protein VK284_14560 [Streptosporangiaceae bacterium]|nr:hypothetical protein [Streptosporangiaceae bacterium]